MAAGSRYDAWQAGDSYELYMGRWSRMIAPLFIDLLGLPDALEWLELGCGTGALTTTILRRCAPASIVAIDPSEGFIAAARANAGAGPVDFRTEGADTLPSWPSGSRDVAVSGLVLNFLPDPAAALAQMNRIVRPGGTVAFYVWDYPGAGVGFMRAFWAAATALDPAAGELAENRRFPFCTSSGLVELAVRAGLGDPQVTALETDAVFPDFDDFWRPFTLGTGPAPGYCASLPADHRAQLKDRLRDSLPQRDDGSIALKNRAWAVVSRRG